MKYGGDARYDLDWNSDEQAGYTLEVWLKKLAEGGTGEFAALDWSQCAAVESVSGKVSGLLVLSRFQSWLVKAKTFKTTPLIVSSLIVCDAEVETVLMNNANLLEVFMQRLGVFQSDIHGPGH